MPVGAAFAVLRGKRVVEKFKTAPVGEKASHAGREGIGVPVFAGFRLYNSYIKTKERVAVAWLNEFSEQYGVQSSEAF